MSRGWNFEVVDADEKRVFRVKVERLLGFFEGEDGDDGGDENLVRGFFGSRGKNTAGEEEMTMAVEKEISASVQFAAGETMVSDGGSSSSTVRTAAAVTGADANGGEPSGASIVASAVAAAVEEDMTHAEAMSRQAKMLNISESNRVERLVEQNEMKAAAVRAETLLREEVQSQDEEVANDSYS